MFIPNVIHRDQNIMFYDLKFNKNSNLKASNVSLTNL